MTNATIGIMLCAAMIHTDNIKIVPIFDQSAPGVWDDFADIRKAARFRKNVQIYVDIPACEFINEFVDSWKRYKNHFAFGAYDNGEMVGFVRGHMLRHSGYLDGMYILPEYQSLGIGSRLLVKGEDAIKMFSKRAELVARHSAISFYNERGYTALTGYGVLSREKELKPRRSVSVQPLFFSSAHISRQCAAIYPEYNADYVNVEHRPAFVYLDTLGNIGGFVNDQGKYVKPGAWSSFSNNMLDRAIAQYQNDVQGR